MPHFYLHVTNSFGSVPDEEGSDHDELDAAREVAVATIRSLLSEEVKSGRLDLNGFIDIVDTAGDRLTRIHYDQAVTVVTGTGQ